MTFPFSHPVSELVFVTHVFNVCLEFFGFPPKNRKAEATGKYVAGKTFLSLSPQALRTRQGRWQGF